MIDRFLMDVLGVLSCPFWSTVLQFGAQLPLHTVNCWTVQSVVPCYYLGVCLSVTLLIVDLLQFCVCCIRSGVTRCTHLKMLHLDRTVYVPVRVTRGALVAHRYSYAPPRCRTFQPRKNFVGLSVSIWNDLADPVFDGVGLASFKSKANDFLLT